MPNIGLRLLFLACVGHGLRVATVPGPRPRSEVGTRGTFNQLTNMLMAFNPTVAFRFASTGRHAPNRIASVPRVFNIRSAIDTKEMTMKEFVCSNANCGYTVFPALGKEQSFFLSFSCPTCKAPADAFVDIADASDPRRSQVLAAMSAQEVPRPPAPPEEIVAAEDLPRPVAPPEEIVAAQPAPPVATVSTSEAALETAPALPDSPFLTDNDEYEEVELDSSLHEFRCEKCGYTLFPAEGREGKFFPEKFNCPQSDCDAPKESFHDMTDLTDARTVKALREEGYVIEEVEVEGEESEEEEEQEMAEAAEGSTPSTEAVAPVEDSAPSAETVPPTPAVAEAVAPTPAVSEAETEAASEDRNEFQKFLDAQREAAESAAPAEASPAPPAVTEENSEEYLKTAMAAALQEQAAKSQGEAMQPTPGASSASPVGNQAEPRPRRPATLDDWVAYKDYPPPPIHQLSRRGEEPPPEVAAKPPEEEPAEQKPREEAQPTHEAAPTAKVSDSPSEDKPVEEEPREKAQQTQEAAPSAQVSDIPSEDKPAEKQPEEEAPPTPVVEEVVQKSEEVVPDLAEEDPDLYRQIAAEVAQDLDLEGLDDIAPIVDDLGDFDPLVNDLIGSEPLTSDELKNAKRKLDEYVTNSANRAEDARKAAEALEKQMLEDAEKEEQRKKKEEEMLAKLDATRNATMKDNVTKSEA